jgi:hypothetical protein
MDKGEISRAIMPTIMKTLENITKGRKILGGGIRNPKRVKDAVPISAIKKGNGLVKKRIVCEFLSGIYLFLDALDIQVVDCLFLHG